MELDLDGAAAYAHRPVKRDEGTARERLATQARLSGTGRAVDRMLIALRAYEQRAQQRARLHMWVMTRRAAGEGAPG
jgi:hypothetical protein